MDDVAPFVKGDAHRVRRARRFDQPVFNRHVVSLGNVCAEDPVKDHQDAAMVAVEVIGVLRMMDPVRRRRVDDAFKGAELADEIGVQP